MKKRETDIERIGSHDFLGESGSDIQVKEIRSGQERVFTRGASKRNGEREDLKGTSVPHLEPEPVFGDCERQPGQRPSVQSVYNFSKSPEIINKTDSDTKYTQCGREAHEQLYRQVPDHVCPSRCGSIHSEPPNSPVENLIIPVTQRAQRTPSLVGIGVAYGVRTWW